MNLKPHEDAALIGDAADRFLLDRKACEASGLIAPDAADVWASMAEMGWLALPLPEDMGGLAASPDLLAVIAEALGKACACQPFVANMAALLTVLATNDAAAAALSADIAQGDRRAVLVRGGALAVMEDASGGCRLDGDAPLVAGGSGAHTFVIVAQYGDGPALFLVDADADGLARARIETVDGSDVADLRFRKVALPEPLQTSGDLAAQLDRIGDLALLLLCAEAVGAMDALVRATADHVGTRQQFGKSLRSFQVVDHAIAEMQVALEEARSVLRIALARVGHPPDQRQRSVCAARVKAADAARRVSHHAIQFHGAMGVTDELHVGFYAKRLLAIGCALETQEETLDRYAALLRAGKCWSYLGENAGDPFRKDVAGWLDDNLPPEIARAQRQTTMVYLEAETANAWQQTLHARGWGAPNWPEAFGGTGWSAMERYIWAHECARRFTPVTSPLGLPLVGPVLFAYGTPEQQARFLPPIVSGEELWCQGFSEPGAGSDLAALSTRAVRDGDDYIVNGTKIWTTQGHEAQMMAALVRTGTPESKRDGISFLLIDMRAPGIEIRPIQTIGGDHELNQIFFDDVRVPAAHLVGNEGQGWEIAKYLLEYERGGDIMSAAQRALLRDIHEAAVARGCDGEDYRRKVAGVAIDIETLEAMELLVLQGEAVHPAIPSILKLRVSETQQAVTELGDWVLGRDAVRWVSQRPLHADPSRVPEDSFVSRYLNSRANTIFGGAREIQKTLIARCVT